MSNSNVSFIVLVGMFTGGIWGAVWMAAPTLRIIPHYRSNLLNQEQIAYFEKHPEEREPTVEPCRSAAWHSAGYMKDVGDLSLFPLLVMLIISGAIAIQEKDELLRRFVAYPISFLALAALILRVVGAYRESYLSSRRGIPVSDVRAMLIESEGLFREVLISITGILVFSCLAIGILISALAVSVLVFLFLKRAKDRRPAKPPIVI